MASEWCGRTTVSAVAVAMRSGTVQALAASTGRHLYMSNPVRLCTECATAARASFASLHDAFAPTSGGRGSRGARMQ